MPSDSTAPALRGGGASDNTAPALRGGAAFTAIEAQEGALQVVRHALQSGRLAQGYLFVGPSGVGKQLTALALARAALCAVDREGGCGACETCRRIDQGVHPDVRVFAPR